MICRYLQPCSGQQRDAFAASADVIVAALKLPPLLQPLRGVACVHCTEAISVLVNKLSAGFLKIVSFAVSK
jgi:hypothetical protein